MESIAIDGPAGVGKSTIAALLAKKLKVKVFDSGAIYRAFAISVKDSGISINDEDALLEHLREICITVKHENGEQCTFVNDKDVTAFLKLPGVGELTSRISSYPKVRTEIDNVFEKIGVGEGYVIEGRDIGTHLLPNVKNKFFLTASLEVRAKRRMKQYSESGTKAEIRDIIGELELRDYMDTTRDIAPFKKAKDAILIDCSETEAEETVGKMLEIIKQKNSR